MSADDKENNGVDAGVQSSQDKSCSLHPAPHGVMTYEVLDVKVKLEHRHVPRQLAHHEQQDHDQDCSRQLKTKNII